MHQRYSVRHRFRQLFQHFLFRWRYLLPYPRKPPASLSNALSTLQHLSLEGASVVVAHCVAKGMDIVLPGIDQRQRRRFGQPSLEQLMADVALSHPNFDGAGKDAAPLLVIDGAVSPGNGHQGDQGQRGQCLAVDIECRKFLEHGIVGDAGRCRQRLLLSSGVVHFLKRFRSASFSLAKNASSMAFRRSPSISLLIMSPPKNGIDPDVRAHRVGVCCVIAASRRGTSCRYVRSDATAPC